MKSRHEKGDSVVVTSLIAVSFAMALILATVGTGVISNDAEAAQKNKQVIKKQQSKVLVPDISKQKQDKNLDTSGCNPTCLPAITLETGMSCNHDCGPKAPIVLPPGHRAPTGDPGDILP